MLPLQIHLTLPPWIDEVADIGRRYASDDERVGLAIELSRQNVERGGGGPFGAAVFDAVSGRLVAAGVNRVVSQNCSVAHAEMMAIMIAQQRLSRSRMNEDDGHYVLATSSQPCCQCYGAMVWAALDVPTIWLGKLNDAGDTAATAVVVFPVPVIGTSTVVPSDIVIMKLQLYVMAAVG